MKKYILFFLMLLSVQMVAAQGMSDQQVLQFIQKETKAGTSQSQIVTKLMQRGVKVDQIQRLRKQYADKMKNSSMGAAAEKAADDAEDRMRKANAATTRMGKSDDETANADDDLQLSSRAETPANPDGNLFNGKKVFGRDIFNNKNLNFEPNMNLATPQNYVLGPGDKVYVDIYGASQKTEELTVSPDGDITVPG